MTEVRPVVVTGGTSGIGLAIRAVLPTMIEQQHGRIVTIGSVLGSVGAAERAAYAATKGAVAAMTRSVALEVTARGVTVNCVAPGRCAPQ